MFYLESFFIFVFGACKKYPRVEDIKVIVIIIKKLFQERAKIGSSELNIRIIERFNNKRKILTMLPIILINLRIFNS